MARRKNYLKDVDLDATPQSEPIEGTVKNSAGGYSFKVDKWTQLDRFLILGSEGGTYYINEQKLTKANAKNVRACIKEDGVRTVARIVQISEEGRAAKNDPALFAHALASVEGDESTRRAAYDSLPRVARIGTHLFHWLDFRKQFGGFGAGARKAVSAWYNDKDSDKLGYQILKYKQRDGWAHLDALRLAHVKPSDPEHDALFAYAKSLAKGVGIEEKKASFLSDQVRAAIAIANEKNKKRVISLITDYNLPREVVPTQFLDDVEIWAALLDRMPMTAMIRNLGNMSKIGLLKPNSEAAKKVATMLKNKDVIAKSRVHPIQMIAAHKQYSAGHGFRGKGTWTPVQRVVTALEEAFYMSFKNIEPTGKRWLLGVDVSGSMTWGNVAGLAGFQPNEAAAVMAMVTARSEEDYHIMGFADSFRDLKINARDRLDSVISKTSRLSFGGTDCALPMNWALSNKIDVDTFVVYTDSETWAGRNHPVEALRKYRSKMGIPAKLIVVGLEGNPFTIADPKDAGMLDVVGFDSAAPQIMADFARD